MSRAEPPVRWIGDTMSGATFSDCRTYRYALWRRFEDSTADMAAFIGLNPSTADETIDDPTIRRCTGFARDWGRSGIVMINLFAFRAMLPPDMKTASDPVGPLNDEAIRTIASICHPVVCCWGVHGAYRDRGFVVKQMLRRVCGRSLWHLGLTKGGHPRHPLYLPKDTELSRWERGS